MGSSEYYVIAIIGTIIGMTWVLRSGLSKIEVKLGAHMARDEAEHQALGARVYRLEAVRDKRHT